MIFDKEFKGDLYSNERPIALGKIKDTKELMSKEWENPRNIKDIRELLSKYDRFVPVIGKKKTGVTFIEKRRELFDIGVYLESV